MSSSQCPGSYSRYPKRQRVEVDYKESEDEIYPSTDSEAECVHVKKRVRVKGTSRPLPKRKIFQFLDLPPELRNKIYAACLTVSSLDNKGRSDGIWLQTKQKGYRRGVETIATMTDEQVSEAAWNFNTHSGLWRPTNMYEELREKPHINVNLLRVCKQIHHEAASMLYGQRIVFTEAGAMVAFLRHLTPQSAKMLRVLDIRGWYSSRARKNMGYMAMMLLDAKGAVNIERLEINCKMTDFLYWRWRSEGRRQVKDVPYSVARKIYRECYPFLDAMAMHRRSSTDSSKDVIPEIVDLIKIQDSNFSSAMDWDNNHEEIVRLYRKELRRLIRSGL